MSNRARWTVVGIALAACAAFVVLRNGKGRCRGIRFRGRVISPRRIHPESPGPQSHAAGHRFWGDRSGRPQGVDPFRRNTGTKPVTVFRTVFTCTCLSGGMETAPIAPGKSALLEIAFTGTPGKRSYRTVASLISDEAGACRYDIPVEGKIQQDFILEPETLNFGLLEKDSAKSMETIVRRRDGAAFTIKEIKSPRAEFSFESKLLEEGKSTAYRIKATAKSLRPGTITESATVLTVEFPPQSSPVMTVAMEVQGDYTCVPSTAISGVGAEGRQDTFETAIRSRTGSKVKVDAVQEGQGAKVEFVQEDKSDGSCLLKIRFASVFQTGVPFGEFLITVSGQAEPIHLPYRLEAPSVKSPGNP